MAMTESMNIFDRRLVRRHRERAARDWNGHSFLFQETASRLADRLDDIRRRFPLALDLGCHGGELSAALGARGGIERLVQCDLSPAMAGRAARPGQPAIAADEEALPFAAGCFDLVLSNLSLHWVNDLPGCLRQVRDCLKPDGLFLACLLGGGTLAELRQVLIEAELAENGGAGPRLSPFADLRDCGGLLQRAGFALPVVDADNIIVSYPDIGRMLRDLRGMGESNATWARAREPLRRAILARADDIYRRRFGDGEGRLPATFQVVYLTGWAPHASQPKALRPGAATARLAEALGTTEVSAGEKASPGSDR